MITIHKYPLVLKEEQTIDIPVDHKVLSVGQDGHYNLCIWVQVDDTKYTVPIYFYIIGTGNPIPDVPLEFIGTVKDTFTNPNAVFMWHVFKQK